MVNSTKDHGFEEVSDNLVMCSYCGNSYPPSLMGDPIEVRNQNNELESTRPICKGCITLSEGLEYRQHMEEELPEGEELRITTVDDPLAPQCEYDTGEYNLPDEHNNQNRGWHSNNNGWWQ